MMNFTKTLVLLGLVLMLAQSCSKDDNDPINPFIKTLPEGLYSETTCSSGFSSTISLEDITIELTKASSNTANINASHATLGGVFTVIGEYESDTSLIIGESVIFDEVYHYGSLIHSEGQYIFSMFDTTQVCDQANILYETNK